MRATLQRVRGRADRWGLTRWMTWPMSWPVWSVGRVGLGLTSCVRHAGWSLLRMRPALTVGLRLGSPAPGIVPHAGPDTDMALGCVVCLAHPSRGWVGQVTQVALRDERKWTMQELNTYNVTFAADWGWIGTTVTAASEDEAIESARDYLHAEAGIPWDVICTMPHVEGEYVGVGVA